MMDEEYAGMLKAYVLQKKRNNIQKRRSPELVGVDGCLESIYGFYTRNGFLSQNQLEYVREKMTPARKRGLRWTSLSLKPPEEHRIKGRYAFLEGRRKVILRMLPGDDDILPDIKKMTGVMFDRKNGEWSVSLELINVQQLQAMDFVLDKAIKRWLENVMPTGAAVDDDVQIPGLLADLRDYQRYAVSWFETRGGRVILADEMGLGKSLETIAYCQKADVWPLVIVCPSAVKYNWMNEFKNFLPSRTVAVIEGGYDGTVLPDVDAYVVNYDILAPRGKKDQIEGGWASALACIKPAMVVFDEIHKVKNTKTKRYKASKLLVKKVERVSGLSGTLIENRPVEAFAACNLVSPKLFPSGTEYKHRYCKPEGRSKFGGAKNIPELHKKLTSTIMLRRRKDDVLKDLPLKTRIAVPIQCDLHEYNRIEADTFAWIMANKGSWQDKKKRMNALVRIEALKQAAAKAKMAATIGWIEDFLEDGDGKIAVFGHHIAVLKQLHAPFAKQAIYIDGSVPSARRFALAEQFNNDPKVRVAVGGIEPMGTGLNMQGGMATAFVEFAWKPGLHDQAEDRVRRMTTTWPTFAYYLTAIGTIDVEIAALIDKKRKVVTQVIDGEDPEDGELLIELLKIYERKAA